LPSSLLHHDFSRKSRAQSARNPLLGTIADQNDPIVALLDFLQLKSQGISQRQTVDKDIWITGADNHRMNKKVYFVDKPGRETGSIFLPGVPSNFFSSALSQQSM
jgi:hypothetical protein